MRTKITADKERVLLERETGIRRHRWTSDEVYRAMDMGVFGGKPTDWLRMELIDGELLEKMPQKRPHSIALSRGQRTLGKVFVNGCYIASQVPLHIDRHNDPELDIMVVAGEPDDYEEHPTAKDVWLVVEISDTTLKQDQRVKSRLYARAGIEDYWLINLPARTLEIRRDPAPGSGPNSRYEYHSVTVYTETELVVPLRGACPGILVSDLLPVKSRIDR